MWCYWNIRIYCTSVLFIFFQTYVWLIYAFKKGVCAHIFVLGVQLGHNYGSGRGKMWTNPPTFRKNVEKIKPPLCKEKNHLVLHFTLQLLWNFLPWCDMQWYNFEILPSFSCVLRAKLKLLNFSVVWIVEYSVYWLQEELKLLLYECITHWGLHIRMLPIKITG